MSESDCSTTVRITDREVVILVERLEELKRCERMLDCLKSCGVDNWSWYSDAMQMMAGLEATSQAASDVPEGPEVCPQGPEASWEDLEVVGVLTKDPKPSCDCRGDTKTWYEPRTKTTITACISCGNRLSRWNVNGQPMNLYLPGEGGPV